MKNFGWVIIIFLSLNVYAHTEDTSIHFGETSEGDAVEEVLGTIESVRATVKDIGSYLNHCRSEVLNVQSTNVYAVLEAVGNPSYKGCVEQRLQEVTRRICQSKEDVYAQSQRYETYDQTYERIQNGMDQIEDLHLRHQQWLEGRAYILHDKADEHAGRDGFGFLIRDEYRAYADIFESESYISCPGRDRDDHGV